MFLVLYNFLIKTPILHKTYLTVVSFHFDFRSMLARDLQSIILYDQQGKFVGVRRPNSKLPIEIDGVNIIISDAIGSTGLELKVMTEFSILRPHFNIFPFLPFSFGETEASCNSDRSRGAGCLCWIWRSNAHNLHQFSVSHAGKLLLPGWVSMWYLS